MPLFYLVPVLVGIAAVVQAGINKQAGERWGLAGSVFSSSMVLSAAALIIWLISLYSPDRLPPFFSAPANPRPFSPWFLIPGLLGLVIVTGLPWGIQKIGASLCFVIAIAVQMAASLAWDGVVEGRPFSWVKALGVGIATIGAIVTTRG